MSDPLGELFDLFVKERTYLHNVTAKTRSWYASEAYRLSRRPHFLGGWGLWDVQVGFRRRCVSAPSGW